MSRILFVHNGQERFVCDDLHLLREGHTVHDWYQPGRLFNPVRLYRAAASSDLVFCWFASWHSLFPLLLARMLGKPIIVVVGGYDVANVPQADYGSQRAGLRYILPRVTSQFIIRHATYLIVNSKSAERETLANTPADPRKIWVIYHYVSDSALTPGTARDRLALTVGGVRHSNLYRKGLLPFVQAAEYAPDVTFTVAGQWFDQSIDTLKAAAMPNTTFTDFISASELERLYARASVYVQPSLHEGFGLSVAEAMMGGCIPVVTRAGALPEVVGDCGIYLDSTEPQAIATAIQQALAAPESLRQRARQRILDNFPREQRQTRLNQLVEQATRRR